MGNMAARYTRSHADISPPLLLKNIQKSPPGCEVDQLPWEKSYVLVKSGRLFAGTAFFDRQFAKSTAHLRFGDKAEN